MLPALQCHFTWALDLSRTAFLRVKQHLEDINPQEQSPYLGWIHNLRGFINFQLNAPEDALRSFEAAAEAAEGPHLVVTYGNLAWLHHHLGNEEKSQDYLSRVEVLMETHPPPDQDELLPEVNAERAWTLMSISVKDPLVGEYFLKAIARRPDVVAWNSSYVTWLIMSHGNKLEEEVMETLRGAIERDPENTYLAAQHLNQRAQRGEDVGEEARTLARRIMESPVGHYSGLETLLWLFTSNISANEAIKMAEQLLETYPDLHYTKKCAALCYKWSRSSTHLSTQNQPPENIRTRAIALHQDLIQQNPQISVGTKLDLAAIYTEFDLQKAEQVFQDLLKTPDPDWTQRIYHKYAKFLFHQRHDSRGSARYHMEVVKIPTQSWYRLMSYRILDNLREKKSFPDLELEHFLGTVPPPGDQKPDDRSSPSRDHQTGAHHTSTTTWWGSAPSAGP